MRMKMKMRCVSLFLMVCIMATSIPEIAFAAESKGKEVSVEAGEHEEKGQNTESQSGDGMTWELSEDGTLTIRGEGEVYNGGWDRTKVKTVVIEEGLTSIKEYTFFGCSELTSISLPEGLTSIGDYAFSDCSGLTSISLPESLTGIKNFAFSGCSGLTDMILPEGLESIASGVFANCSGLTSISLPESLTRIGESAFSDCSKLTSISLPESLLEISRCAFRNCSSLISISLPKNITFIGTEVFQGCSGLISVSLPEGLTSIGGYTFFGCSELTSINLPEGLTRIGESAFSGCIGLTSISLPESLTDIENNVFSGCSGLTTAGPIGGGYNIEFGWKSEIPNNAFSGCSELTSVSLPEGVTSIGMNAFSGCSGLTNISLPEGFTSIGMNAFSGCSGLTTAGPIGGGYNIEFGWKSEIPNNAFSSCSGLTSISLPEGVTSIGMSAFSGCSELTSISLPEEVTSIGDGAFSGCSKLTTAGPIGGGYNIEFGWKSEIPSNAFSGCSGLTDISLPKGVTSIGSRAFSGCSGLTDISLPEGVTSIGSSAFLGCSGLTDISLPEGVTNIGSSAFSDCSGLTDISLSEGVTSIGSGTFSNCIGLTSISLPEGVTSIGSSAFSDCSGLTSISLPEGVTSIGSGAFKGCSELTSISLPKGVTSIGDRAFYWCYGLTSINLPKGLTSIGEETFYHCYSLTSINFAEGLTSIGVRAFDNCDGLTSINLPKGFTSIGDNAFSNCDNLAYIEFPEGLTDIGSFAFMKCYSLESINLPKGLQIIKERAFEDCSGLTSISLPEGLTNIGYGTFSGCRGLTSISLPEGVTSIGYGTFSGCSGLTDISLPKGLTSIGYGVFQGCSGLTDISLPEGLEEIGDGAFDYCDALASVICPASLTNIGDYAFSKGASNGGLPDNLTFVVPRGSYAEAYAVEHSIPYSYRTDVGEADLQVKLVPGNIADLQGLRLVIKGKDYYMARSLTAESEYQFSRLMAGRSYTVSVQNTYGDAVSSVKDIVLQTGENSIELTDFMALSSVNARVLTQEGKEVTAGCNIEWLDETGGIYAGGAVLERIPVGRNLNCRVSLGGTLGRSYVTPADMEWKVSEQNKTCTVTLLPFQKVHLKGTVVTENGAASDGAVSFVQKLNGKYDANTFVRTNSEGAFELEAYNQPGVLTVNCRGYKPYTLNVEDLSKDKDLGSILLEELTGTTITVNAAYAKRSEEDSQAVFQILSTLDELSFEIKNEVTGLSVDDYFQQDCCLILPEGVSAGDTLSLTVKSRNDDFAPVESTVTVGSENKAEVSLQLVQRGAIRVSCQKGENDSVCLLIYDENGKQVWRGTYENGRFVLSKGLQDGKYTVVAIGDNPYFAYPASWKGLQDLGLKQGADYVSAQAAVSAGQTTDVLFQQVPLFSDEAYAINDPARTRFSLSRTETSLGRYVSLRGMAPLKKEYEGRVQDFKWIFEIPEECEIMDGSLMVNAEACTHVSREGQELIVSAINPGDTVSMCLLPVLAGRHTINGALEYTMDGRTIRQPIGSLELKVEFSFTLPERVMTKNVTASGITTPSAGVSLYDNGVLVGQTTASLSGSWTIDFELYQPYSYSEHKIYAESGVVNGRVVRTETKTLKYQYVEEPVSVKCVTMLNAYSVVHFFGEEKRTVGFYSYSPSYPSFTFVVEMVGDLSKIGNLKLHVLCSDGRTRTLSPKFDKEKQQWIASEYFFFGSLPRDVEVSFGLEAPIVYSAEEQKDTEDAWKVISGLSERKIFTKVTLPANVKVSKETQKAYDDYNQTLEDMQKACKDLSSVIKDIQGTETGATVQMDGVSLTGTELSVVPSASQIAQEGYVAVPATDGNTQVYQKLEAEGTDSASQGFLIITRESGNVTAKRVEINVSDASHLEKDIDRVMEAGADIPDAIGRFSNAAVSAQKATRAEIEQIKATAGDVEDFQKTELVTMFESLLDGFFESETVADVMRNPSPLNCKGIGAISVSGAQYLSKSFFQVINFISNFQELAEAASHYEYIKKLSANCLSGMKNCDCLAMLKNAHMCYMVVKILIISGLTDLVGTILSMVFPGFGFLGKFLLATGVTALDFWANKTLQKHYGHLNGSCRKCNVFTGKCKICDVCGDNPENGGEDFWEKSKTGYVVPIIDPSGYVYEAVPSNRLEGVTAICYEKVTKYDIYDEPYEEIQLWDASLYEQQNPLLTNSEGCYAWDVPQGLWQVRYEKEGYETAASEWMEVPPPRFDVNVGLVSYEEPGLEEVLAYPEDIEFSFSKYVKVDSLTGETVHVLAAGREIAGTLKPMNEEASPADGTMLATQFAFVPDSKLAVGTAVTVKATAGIRTYAGVSPEKELTALKNVALKPEKFDVTQQLALDYNGEGTLEIAALPAESAAGMEVAVTNDSPMVLDVQEDKVTLDKQGKALVHVKALLPGECAVRFALNGSRLNAQSTVSIANMAEDRGEAEVKTAIDDGKFSVTLSKTVYTYDGKKKEPSVTVKNVSSTLAAGTDYTITYKNNLNAGTATAVITGTGSYTGTLQKTFKINKAKTTIKASGVTKTASKKKITFSVKAKSSRKGTLTYSSNNKSVKIDKKGKVTIAKNFVGKAVITIKMAASANYEAASKKITVKVNPAGVKLTSVKSASSGKLTVKWKKNAKANGYEIQYSTSKKFAKSVTKAKKVKKAAKTSETISKLKKGKTYYVRIRTYKKVSGKMYYSGWSSKKNVKVKR